MSPKVFFIKLLLVHYATQSLAETHAGCNEDVTLECPDVGTDRVDVFSVTWYKLENDEKHGIVRSRKGQHATQFYSFTKRAKFEENLSLFLPSVTPEDSGSYECAITARVGGQNRNLKVHLIVDDCVTQADPTTVLTHVTHVLNITRPDLQAQELSVMWAIIGCVGVGFTKVVLSLISIWVIRAVRSRSSRRRRHKLRS